MNYTAQPSLFDDWETSTGALELFPAVWSAAQGLAHPDLKVRQAALDKLVEMGAPRLSPLVAYLVATRLLDSSLEIRQRVVNILGDLLVLDPEGRETDRVVRQYVTAYLSQMRTRNVYSLLQVAAQVEGLDGAVALILNACAYAGEHLSDIFNDRKIPLSIRKKAVQLAGEVGYLDVIPDLERLQGRLASRLEGQQSMAFAPPAAEDEMELLPLVNQALDLLKKL